MLKTLNDHFYAFSEAIWYIYIFWVCIFLSQINKDLMRNVFDDLPTNLSYLTEDEYVITTPSSLKWGTERVKDNGSVHHFFESRMLLKMLMITSTFHNIHSKTEKADKIHYPFVLVISVSYSLKNSKTSIFIFIYFFYYVKNI